MSLNFLLQEKSSFFFFGTLFKFLLAPYFKNKSLTETIYACLISAIIGSQRQVNAVHWEGNFIIYF